MAIRVAVLGAEGKMGQYTCEAVNAASDMELFGSVSEKDSLVDVLRANDPDVAVDFTTPGSTEANVHTLIDEGVNAVVGATGWTDESLARVRSHLADKGNKTGVLIAPNFAISAVLTMKFAATAAKYFESAEIVELHHPDKEDAPSGTARSTAQGIAAARKVAAMPPMPDATKTGWDARGVDVEGVRIHAVRLRGLVAHEEVLMGNPGEQLTIRQDSFDRVSFMPGVLLAIRKIASHPGLTVGLEHFLEL
ncbi:MAG: 4-hydroxy-tetrahydrodipicolinate reductase [Cellulomonadaceae bacterium]|jgi:4-hydroxy-tetrahydrodipicolinate reductase|nr:4-hydroxy-tetrahydrodipicolinate reductase [Cellulomonadaceae bacterium]